MSLIPPLVMKVRIREEGKRGFGLWLPIFLLLPFIYFFIGMGVLLLLLLSLLTLKRGVLARPWIALLEPFRIFHALRGFTIDVKTRKERVLIALN